MKWGSLVCLVLVVGCGSEVPKTTIVMAPGVLPCCVAAKPGEPRLPDPASAHAAGAGKIVPTVVIHEPPPHPAPEGMVWIPPGEFSMGSDYVPFADAQPIHAVQLDGFFMDAKPVTNAEFYAFVKATGYKTVAERPPDPRDFPGVPKENLVPGALVFQAPTEAVSVTDPSQWWSYVPGACWYHPEGPDSSLDGREDHPVVQVAWEDAMAYAKWAGKRLPTEAEWEYAARGGLTQKPYVWGDQFCKNGKLMANTFQGHFPDKNTLTDGYSRTSPVGKFPKNGFGLYDMAGNVWNWCSDWYRPDYYARSPVKNPQGPPNSDDPEEPGVKKRVVRGGSFLCTDQYCSRYMPGGRMKESPDTGACHIGFRCVISGGKPPKITIPRKSVD